MTERAFPPDARIFASTRPSWLETPTNAKACAGFYSPKTIWSGGRRGRCRATRERAGEA